MHRCTCSRSITTSSRSLIAETRGSQLQHRRDRWVGGTLTLSLGGTRFEIPARLRHLSVVHVRYARWDFSRVDLVDARTGAVLCPIRPLDKAANANGHATRTRGDVILC